MNLKGDYNGSTTYSVGDVVRYTDGVVYQKLKPCKSGIPPIETLYWDRLPQPLQEAADMMLDFGTAVEAEIPDVVDGLSSTSTTKALSAKQGKVLNEKIPTNISQDAITLKGTGDNEYLITVDDSGETPDLVVTLITEEGT